ncbi:MerR family transcriptional regulator [Actinomadura mexicana]|uniref:DNA-binding transcriptional regulator, MerR family n=1 Tax=Actinomadura mexicana TaxID=134959 RepID=A0A238UT09_9ACTN|nr:MerR family transcriptional regulator [Actinomadura mexicana]SNR25014.1 DNA-binding transcriptional regulator, MerR family [Actinomadura mexicana]
MTGTAMDDAAGPGGLTIGAAASHAGVTVRTLHHWDAIGLVRPSERTAGGYRLYSAADVARINRVLIYRELGLSLDDIGELLDAPAVDMTVPLRQQRAQLLDRISRLQAMVDAVDRMIEAASAGILLSAEEQAAIFGQRWKPSWLADARERWGETAQWAQSAERAAGRAPEDWQQIADDIATLENDLATAKRAGVRPGSAEADVLAERHRASIGEYFDCTHSMQVCLGRRYAADPGFAAYYDAIEPGLTSWLRDIIDANARGKGIDPDSATWT